MMESFQIYPVFSTPVLIISTAVILIFLMVLEFKRKSKYRVLNILLHVVIVMSLLGLALRPGVQKKAKPEPVILLTSNFDENVVDSLLSQYRRSEILHTNGNSFLRSSLLESIDRLDKREVFVVGDGIPEYDLKRLKSAKFHFIPSQNVAGIQSLLPDEPFTVNRWGRITGSIKSEIDNSSLLLRGADGILDSIKLSKSGVQFFELKFRPKLDGNFLYSIEQKDSVGKLLFAEPLPITVCKERKLDVLILQDFPTVETRFLKNFLGEKGHRIAIRYGISRNIDRFEFVNREKLPLEKISETLLQQFDVMLVPSRTYENMAPDIQRMLKQSIKMGLGVLVMLDEDSSGCADLLQLEFMKSDNDTIRVLLNEEYFNFPVPDIRLKEDEELVPVLKGGGQVVEGFTSSGMGRIGFQLLHETYLFLLSEKPGVYAGIWSPLLEAVARKEMKENQMQIRSSFPWFKDEPLEIQVISSRRDPNLRIDGIAVPLKEDSRIDGIWTSTIWPQSGWNQLTLDSTRLDFFVAEDGTWNTLRKANQIESNRLADNSMEESGNENVIIEEKISPLIFFIAFLMASGALWLIPKL